MAFLLGGKCNPLRLKSLTLHRTDCKDLKRIHTSAIGIMSGTSLDGLDLAYCDFEYDGNWHFAIKKTRCVSYDDSWRSALAAAHQIPKDALQKLDVDLGIFIAEQINDFLNDAGFSTPDLVCSHGHTVFHDPANKFTLQIGSGADIAQETGIICIYDFRSLDVSLGGQGAPLVPIGDELLFSEYDACLNLGGFSNVSFRRNDERIAFDICPVNIGLNPLAQQLGLPYDENGNIARTGSVDQLLLQKLNTLPIYKDSSQPSFAREWLERSFLPLVNSSNAKTEDLLSTLTEHAAIKIAEVLNKSLGNSSVLVTGGGVRNAYLMERIQTLSEAKIIIPNDELIDFKEALIFAFLGVLRLHDKTNVLSSVTGAERDSSSGVIHVGAYGNTPSTGR